MRWFPFVSRVAFICNLLFLGSLLLQWKYLLLDHDILSTIAIAGLILGPFVFNPLAALFYIILRFGKKTPTAFVPKWLVVTNFIFLAVQFFFALFYLYDPFHS